MFMGRKFILLALFVLLAGVSHDVQHLITDPHHAAQHSDAHHHDGSNTPAPIEAEAHCLLTAQAGQLAYEFAPQFTPVKNPQPALQHAQPTPSIARTVLFFSRAPPALV